MPGTKRTIVYLESKFETGDIPTQTDFQDLFASFIHYQQLAQTTGSDTEIPMSQDAVTDALAALGGGVVVHITYADIAAMLADQANQDVGKWYMATDASADATVDSGWAIYQKLAPSTASLTDYQKIAEQESLDVIVTNASETVKGIVEEATDAEMQAGTASGGTGAKLFSTPAKLATWWTWLKTQTANFTGILTGKHLAASWQTLTDAATILWNGNNGNFAQVTIGGDRTLDTISNPLSGALYIIRVVQDGSGNRTLAFHANYTFPGSVTPILNPAASAATVLSFFYDGTAFRYCGASGDYKLSNLYLTAIAASSGKKRPIYIDDTGKILRQTWVELDTTNLKTTVTGVDDLMTTILHEWKNASGNSIMQILNGLRVVFGGTSSIIEVTTGIASDNASLKVNDDQAKAYKFVDKTGNEFAVIKSTTGDLSFIIRQKTELNTGAGFTKVSFQTSVVTDTTAAAWTNVFKLVITASTSAHIKVNHLFAYATDASVAIAYGNMDGYAKNVAGTVSGTNPSYTISGDGITGVAWRINPDDSDNSINIDFQNNSGTGKTWHVVVDFSYIVRSLPS